MPRQVKGTFATYQADGYFAKHPSDEEAAVEASEEMFSMCGNAGQESLIGDYLDDFFDWAIEILEDESTTRGSTYEDFAAMVIEEWYEGDIQKWAGTDLIWAQGWVKIAEQSGYHDAYDEMGEGAGREFFA